MRLASKNYYPSPTWILNIALMTKSDKIFDEDSINKIKLSQLMRLEFSKFLEMLPSTIKVQNIYNYNKYAVKVCPYCLAEANYCRDIWDCEILRACPIHKCLLIYQCPSCQKALKWSRPGVSQCQCGFDFRRHQSQPANIHQILLAHYLYVLDGAPQYFLALEKFYNQQNPIFELSLSNFLQLSKFFFPYIRAYLRHYQFWHQSEPIFTDYFSECAYLSESELFLILFQNWPNNFSQILLWYQSSLQTLKTQSTYLKSMQDLLGELSCYFPSGGAFHQFLDSYRRS